MHFGVVIVKYITLCDGRQFLFTSCFHRFDCEFVTSEENANIHYFVKTDSRLKLAGSNNDKVGKNMSTKADGSDS